jgi:hypothetical protein
MDAAESMDRRGRGEKEEGGGREGKKGREGRGRRCNGRAARAFLPYATRRWAARARCRPLRALQLDVGPRTRGAARLQPERSRTAQSARRSQRGAAAQAACAAQPRGRDALCAAAARMRRASSCANARPNRGEPASTDSSRGAAASGSAGRGYEERKVRGTCFLVRRT